MNTSEPELLNTEDRLVLQTSVLRAFERSSRGQAILIRPHDNMPPRAAPPRKKPGKSGRPWGHFGADFAGRLIAQFDSIHEERGEPGEDG
ncbi:MAG: hypothetical protein GMKNLPBB_01916 [Myxococcota bacterium]|nr:hypothetical protein [Myxococcota bacterium]